MFTVEVDESLVTELLELRQTVKSLRAAADEASQAVAAIRKLVRVLGRRAPRGLASWVSGA